MIDNILQKNNQFNNNYYKDINYLKKFIKNKNFNYRDFLNHFNKHIHKFNNCLFLAFNILH